MTDPNELVDLRTKYDKLAAELSFERQMNNILENIRNYCLLMLNECQCPMSTIGDNMQVFHKLNRQFIQLKVKQLIDNSDDCDHRECCKTRDNTLDINDFVDTEPENTVLTDVVPEDDEPVPDGDQLIMLEISEEVEVDNNQIAEQMNQQDEHDTDTDIDTDTVHSPPEPTTSVTLAEPEADTTPQSSRSPAKTPERVKRAYKKSSYNLSSLTTRKTRSTMLKPSRLKTLRNKLQKSSTQITYVKDRAKLGPKPKAKTTKLPAEEVNSATKARDQQKNGLKGTNKYQCSQCHQLLPSEIKLKNHLSYKHKIRSFACHLCDYKTTQTYYLRRHMTCHTDSKPFTCDIPGCNKRFKTRAIVLAHKRQSHAPSRDFQCPLCDYKGTTKSRLDSHWLTHSTDKPFKCDIKGCDKWFKTSVAVYQHKVVVHSGQTFHCDWPQCKRTYKSKYALDLHRKLHSADKQFFCGINGCVKGFKEKRNLKRHQQKCIQNFLCKK